MFCCDAGGELCTCSDWHGCLMQSSLSGEDGIQPFKFSECSFKQFQRGMEQGSALCLLNRYGNTSHQHKSEIIHTRAIAADAENVTIPYSDNTNGNIKLSHCPLFGIPY